MYSISGKFGLIQAASSAAAQQPKKLPRGDRLRSGDPDDIGRSLAQDRKKSAKRSAKPGQGDKGDRKRK
jgi:hypothetical protein